MPPHPADGPPPGAPSPVPVDWTDGGLWERMKVQWAEDGYEVRAAVGCACCPGRTCEPGIVWGCMCLVIAHIRRGWRSLLQLVRDSVTFKLSDLGKVSIESRERLVGGYADLLSSSPACAVSLRARSHSCTRHPLQDSAGGHRFLCTLQAISVSCQCTCACMADCLGALQRGARAEDRTTVHGPWELFRASQTGNEEEAPIPPGSGTLPHKLQKHLLGTAKLICTLPRGPQVWNMRGGGAAGKLPSGPAHC